jgi:hypothetical protein
MSWSLAYTIPKQLGLLGIIAVHISSVLSERGLWTRCPFTYVLAMR